MDAWIAQHLPNHARKKALEVKSGKARATDVFVAVEAINKEIAQRGKKEMEDPAARGPGNQGMTSMI